MRFNIKNALQVLKISGKSTIDKLLLRLQTNMIFSKRKYSFICFTKCKILNKTNFYIIRFRLATLLLQIPIKR